MNRKGRRHLLHPSRRRLAAWLEDDGLDAKVDAHVATCDRCATRLDDLSEPAVPLGDALRSMLSPPEDLQPRLRNGIARKLQTREDLRLMIEMLGVPWQTAQLLADPPPEPPASPGATT